MERKKEGNNGRTKERNKKKGRKIERNKGTHQGKKVRTK